MPLSINCPRCGTAIAAQDEDDLWTNSPETSTQVARGMRP